MEEMSNIIHLHDIEIRALDYPHDDLPSDMQMFAQVIVDKHILQQTVPFDPEETSQTSWKIKIECTIPEHVGTFMFAILRHSKSRGTRLLGFVEIERNEALASAENETGVFRIEFCQ
ncbi:hypothetical protein K438DRAFT_1952436 [Mycena galopus ATCC 62051]|nr:hypothetical protein K438DRAFT_1952436 [Mycena galopus ATCC 62051]